MYNMNNVFKGVLYLMENFNLSNYRHIHMIGIGGISMSGIAEILLNSNFIVTGSDATQSEITDKLIQNGIKVTIGHDFINVRRANLVVYSAAVKPNDPELVEARKFRIPTIERGDFLGEITKLYKDTICISGTHGKTTTTSMVALSFLEAQKDPTIQVGAILKNIDGNYRVGNSDYLIIEACEYVESFLKFFPKSEIILNIDNDHLDYFKTFENIKNAFIKYVKKLPDDGLLVLNGDDDNCLDLAKYTSAKTITYGINNTNTDYIARNLVCDAKGCYQFEVYKNNSFYEIFKLNVPGTHNILNALSCIALCDNYGISSNNIKNALFSFNGADRRFDFVGTYNGFDVYDDYAHHPTEIKALAKSVQNTAHNKSWAIFQSHTFSRTKLLLDDFANALLDFDNVIITDIYAARETNKSGITPQYLVNKLNELGKQAIYIGPFEDISKYIRENAKENDIVLTVGAGTITKLGNMIIKA